MMNTERTCLRATMNSDLEVRLLQYAYKLVGSLAAVSDRVQLFEDVLNQLHVVLPHSLQFGFFKLLMSL